MPTLQRIVSLWTMIQLPLGKLTQSFHQLTRLQELLRLLVYDQPGNIWAMSFENLTLYKSTCRNFAECAKALELVHCENLALKFLEVLNRAGEGIAEGKRVAAIEEVLVIRAHRLLAGLGDALESESAGRLFLALNKSEVNQFQNPNVFGPDVQSKFSSIVYDLEEFTKCTALSRNTAAVFHLMRVLESGLKAMSLCLGSTAPTAGQGRAWGAILSEMRDLKKGNPPAWPENDLFSEFYALLDAVMRAWRNATMHLDKKYDPSDVERIGRVVMHFMEALAKRMDENGMPRA